MQQMLFFIVFLFFFNAFIKVLFGQIHRKVIMFSGTNLAYRAKFFNRLTVSFKSCHSRAYTALRTLSSPFLSIFPYHLTQFAFSNPHTISFNPSMFICSRVVFSCLQLFDHAWLLP